VENEEGRQQLYNSLFVEKTLENAINWILYWEATTWNINIYSGVI
jgi:hypothetical protein